MSRTRSMRVFTVFLLCLSVVALTRSAAAMDAMEYRRYINKVFGYSLQYPDIFFDGAFEEDSDEVVMKSIHKKYPLKAWGRELKRVKYSLAAGGVKGADAEGPLSRSPKKFALRFAWYKAQGFYQYLKETLI